MFSPPGGDVTATEGDSDGFGQVTPDAPAWASLDFSKIRGRMAPRLWTRPLRALTPETSYGYAFMTWCADHAYPLDRWERWIAVHVGELLEDGRPRFRRVVIIVARQNGKTLLIKLLILYWAYEDSRLMILMTSSGLGYARAAWASAVEMAGAALKMPLGVRQLEDIGPPKIRQANGQEQMLAPYDKDADRGGGTFAIAASKGDSGGRSLTIDRLVMDEVREHRTWDAYNAGVPAMNAAPRGQGFFISNKGGTEAEVLNGLRDSALAGHDRRLGLFEYSCPEGSRPDDLEALRYANPNLGVPPYGRIDPETLLGEALTAMSKGGDALIQFKTEIMCMDVPRMNPAVDPDGWRECSGDASMDALRNRVACCLDISLDGSGAMLAAAAVGPDGRVRLEAVEYWDSIRAMRRALPRLVAKVKPRVFGWFPKGPAAVVTTELAAPKANKARRSAAWPPAGVRLEEIRAEVPAVCMGFADLVMSREIIHPDDEVINAHVADTEKLWEGDVWVFARRGAGTAPGQTPTAGPICGAYAAAGAVHLARTIPEPSRRTRLHVAK
jgi:hypothetical protein